MKRAAVAFVVSLALMSLCGSVVCTAAILSAAEADGLTYMREEEKLARDVYLALYRQWGTPIFSNIALSEQTHMDRILMLLGKYDLPDPAAGKLEGEFTHPVFVELYQLLVASGSESLVQAFEVGVFIEETDIEDINNLLAITTRKDIRNVYTNLLAGSYNHLAAFDYQLAQ